MSDTRFLLVDEDAPPPYMRKPEPQRRRSVAPVAISICVVIGLAAIGAFFIGMGSGSRDLAIAETSAVATIDGDDVALVVYHDDLRPGLGEPMFQMRLAAYRLSDGEQLWDQRVNEELIADVVVLAASDDHIYLASDAGLSIRSTADGALLADGLEIDGLGENAVLAAGAYGYDAETDAITILSATGDILALPVGSLTAENASGAVRERWDDRLSTAGLTMIFSRSVVTEAEDVEGVRLRITTLNEAVQRDELEITASDGTLVQRLEFTRAAILPVQPLIWEGDDGPSEGERTPIAAGSALGYALVEHLASVNDDTRLVSSIDLRIGEIVETVELDTEILRVLSGPEGETALPIAPAGSTDIDRMLVLQSDGTFDEITVGRLPWWLAPFG